MLGYAEASAKVRDIRKEFHKSTDRATESGVNRVAAGRKFILEMGLCLRHSQHF